MRKGFVNLATSLLSILLAIFLVEGLLRVFLPFYFCDNHGVYRFDEQLRIVPRTNINIKRTKDYFEEYITNKYGTVNYQSNFEGYQYLVFALGDSHTQGIGSPPDASYPFQLDLLLNLKDNEYKPKYAVVNLGLASYGGKQELLALKKYLNIIGKPNFILLLGCSNDYGDDLRFSAFQRGESFNLIDGNPKLDWLIRPLAWVGYETEIGKRLYWVVKNYQKKSLIRKEAEVEGSVVPVAEREANIYEEVNKIAKGLNAKLIVSWANMDESYDWLKKWSNDNHIAFADWRPAAMSVKKSIPDLPLENQHSGGHYRTWVTKIIAESFAKHIKKI